MGRIHSVMAFDIRKVKYKETMNKKPLKDLRMVWGYIQINGQLAFKRRLLLRDRGCRSGKLYKHNDWVGWKIDQKSQRTCLEIPLLFLFISKTQDTKLQTSNCKIKNPGTFVCKVLFWLPHSELPIKTTVDKMPESHSCIRKRVKEMSGVGNIKNQSVQRTFSFHITLKACVVPRSNILQLLWFGSLCATLSACLSLRLITKSVILI